MEEARPEKHGAVLAIGHDEAITSLLFQKCYDPFPVLVVVLDLPIIGRRRPANDQATTPGVEVGFRRRDPEVDADGGIVGVDIDGRLRPQPFEGPGLGQRVATENFGKRAPEFVRDLQKQRTGEPIFQIGRNETVDMGEVVPDRALQQEPPQRGERLTA